MSVTRMKGKDRVVVPLSQEPTFIILCYAIIIFILLMSFFISAATCVSERSNPKQYQILTEQQNLLHPVFLTSPDLEDSLEILPPVLIAKASEPTSLQCQVPLFELLGLLAFCLSSFEKITHCSHAHAVSNLAMELNY